MAISTTEDWSFERRKCPNERIVCGSAWTVDTVIGGKLGQRQLISIRKYLFVISIALYVLSR
jgi:hypothetical protein